MKKLLGILVFLFACSTHRPQAPEPAKVRQPVEFVRDIFCHGDLTFSGDEREHLENAAAAWRMESKGKSNMYISWDIDFDNAPIKRVQEVANDCLIIRTDSDNPVIQMADAQHPGFMCVGLTFSKEPVRVYFPMDRILPERLVGVAMHEFGHVFLLGDLPTRGDVMSQEGWLMPGWFTEVDHAECARVGACR